MNICKVKKLNNRDEVISLLTSLVSTKELEGIRVGLAGSFYRTVPKV